MSNRSVERDTSLEAAVQNTLDPNFAEVQCKVELKCLNSKRNRKKKNENLSDRHDLLDNVNIRNHDDTEGASVTMNTSFDKDTCLEVPVKNNLEPNIREAQCNAKLKTEKNGKTKKKKLNESHEPLDKANTMDNDSVEAVSLMKNTSLERAISSEAPIKNSPELDLPESQCNMELKCSQMKEKRKKTSSKEKRKKNSSKEKRNKKENMSRRHGSLDKVSSADPDFTKGASLLTDSSWELDTSLEASAKNVLEPNLTEAHCNVELIFSQTKKKMQNAESDVDVNINTDSKTTQISESSLLEKQGRQKKRKRKHNVAVVNDKSHVSLDVEEVDLIKMEGNTSTSEKQSGSPEIVNASLTEPVMLTGKTLSDHLDEVHSLELLDTKLERVQDWEHAAIAVESVLTEKAASNCSNGVVACEGNKKMIEISNVDPDGPMKVMDEDNVVKLSHIPPVGSCIGRSNKKLLILDVNGLLADVVALGTYVPSRYRADIVVSKKSVFKRPFCDDFLHFCFETFNVGVWSSRTKRNVDLLIDFLMGDAKHNLVFCWDQSHCTNTGFTTVENRDKPLVLKELKKLWENTYSELPWKKGEYDESNTLLLDDSPYKALCNPVHTAIFPCSYRFKDIEDSSLGPGGDLRVYLERLAEAQNVQDYVAQNPFGQRAITESDPSWGFYSKIINAVSSRYQNVSSVICQ